MFTIHSNFAESNLICSLCQTIANNFNQMNFSHNALLFNTFPKLEQIFENMNDDYSSYQEFCTEYVCNYPINFYQNYVKQPFDLINVGNQSWVSGINSKFENMTKNEIKRILGAVIDSDWQVKSLPKKYENYIDLPENFDARNFWPQCSQVINHIRDQSNCGSCWAHGTTEAFNDRLCIASKGQFTKLLSVADTTGCCNGLKCLSFGCNGGQVSTPWNWFDNTGVVTGGDFGDNELCYDYPLQQCNHHSSGNLPNCSEIQQIQPQCDHNCPSNNTINYFLDKITTGNTSYHLKSVQDIKQDIFLYGSVTGAFNVYEDFLTYKSGIYNHIVGDSLGGHAIKIIGWGVQNGIDYWLCVNSWNSNWGENGTFKIQIGDSGINDSVYAGIVNFNNQLKY